MKITVVGTGYVGLVSGACLADLGHEVTCVDVDAIKIENLKQGQIPIYEIGLDEIVQRNISQGRLIFSTSLAHSIQENEIVFIAVGTPQSEDGSADLKYVLDVAREIGQDMTSYKMVIVKSTVPVGTVHKVKNVIKSILISQHKDIEFDIASNPEFLKEGDAVHDFMKPDRIVAGVETERAAHNIQEIFAPLTRQGYPLVLMDVRSSEITKYAANSMLALRISFMNELASLCEATGADIEQVRQGIGSDSRIGTKFLAAGLGYGGSCFPKDVLALINTMQELSLPARILSSVHEVNSLQRQKFVQKIKEHFGGNVHGKKIALWGLSFKPGTDDVREAPSLTIVSELISLGAIIRVHDPISMLNFESYYSPVGVKYCQDMYSAVDGADALLVVTEWLQFREADLAMVKRLMNQKIIFDGRNIYDPVVLEKMGFEYFAFGRSPQVAHFENLSQIKSGEGLTTNHEYKENLQ